MTDDDIRDMRADWPEHYRAGRLGRKLARMIAALPPGPAGNQDAWVLVGATAAYWCARRHLDQAVSESDPATAADRLLDELGGDK